MGGNNVPAFVDPTAGGGEANGGFMAPLGGIRLGRAFCVTCGRMGAGTGDVTLGDTGTSGGNGDKSFTVAAG